MTTTDPFFNTLNNHINGQLLKHAAGQQITCPVCGDILDWKTTIIVEAYKDNIPKGRAIVCWKCFKPEGIPKLEAQGITVEITKHKS